MRSGLQLDRKRKPTAPDRGQQFFTGLDGALCPAMLLRLEAVHVYWQLCWSDDIGKINKFPACKLGAIAEIEVLAQGIVLPASTLFDTRTPPEASSSTKIEKSAAAAAGGLLKSEMSIQTDRVHARQQRITAIQMPPGGLDHCYF